MGPAGPAAGPGQGGWEAGTVLELSLGTGAAPHLSVPCVARAPLELRSPGGRVVVLVLSRSGSFLTRSSGCETGTPERGHIRGGLDFGEHSYAPIWRGPQAIGGVETPRSLRISFSLLDPAGSPRSFGPGGARARNPQTGLARSCRAFYNWGGDVRHSSFGGVLTEACSLRASCR